MGLYDEAKFCPFCGKPIHEWYADGKAICDNCGAKFYVNEADDSDREVL